MRTVDHRPALLLGIVSVAAWVVLLAPSDSPASDRVAGTRTTVRALGTSPEVCEPNYFGVPRDLVEGQPETCPDVETAYINLYRTTRSQVLECRALAALCALHPDAKQHAPRAEALWNDFQVNLHMKLGTSIFEIDLDKRRAERVHRTEESEWWRLYYALVERQAEYLDRLADLRIAVIGSVGSGADQLVQNEAFLDRIRPEHLAE